MAHRIGDRIKESTSTTGTGSFTLTGAVAGFRPFSSALLSDTDTIWYAAVSGADWEVGLGTNSGSSTISRTSVMASSNAGALVNFLVPPTVFGTIPAGSHRIETPYTDPAGQYFGPTGAELAKTADRLSGDPVVVWDGAQYIMYFFQTVAGFPHVKTYYQTASSLNGPWSAKTAIASLDGYHKFSLLVDEYGKPVVIGGSYHGYAVYFNNDISTKEIYHATCATLTGAWAVGSKVIGKGASGSKDEFNTDTPCAVLDADGLIHLWYMGAPNSSLATYGLAVRMLKATAISPGGPFTKDYTDVLLPSTSAAWDYGWMGGSQVIKRPDGSYMMLFNAGNTRPSTAGSEPNTSAIGMAYAPTISGPWTKDQANPYMEITGTPSDAIEKTNAWRGFIAWDYAIKKWYLFYNCGGGGTEVITVARQGVYDYFFVSGGNPFNVQNMTTSKVAVANSRVNLTPGLYKVHYAINVMADDTGAVPKLDVDTTLRLNGADYKQGGRDFIGSYAYENRDLILEHIVAVPARGYVDLTVQVTGGTPTVGSFARRLRVNVQRL